MTAPYRIVQFVDSPSTSANVRYNLTSYPERVIQFNTWSDDSPDLLGDPEGYGQEYGRRVVSFTHVVIGSRVDAQAARADLAREILRDGNWLMVQRSDTTPVVFYRTFPTTPGQSVVLEDDGDDSDDATNVWSLSVTVECEATLYGELKSFPLTIPNDPAAVNGIAQRTPTIEGDAPAPLSVSFSTSSAVTSTLVSAALSSWPGLTFWQGESGTMGADTASFSDPGSLTANASATTVARTSFTASTDALRLTFAPTLTQAGKHRVYARVRLGSGSDAVTIRGAGSSLLRAESTAHTGTTSYRWVDLGLFGFPTRNVPTSAPYTLGAGQVQVWAQRTSGSGGSLFIDVLVAVPVDVFEGQSRTLHLPEVASGQVVSLDDESDALSVTSSGALVAGVTSPTGVPLRVAPGVENVIYHFSRLGSTITASQTLTFSYHPRYLWVP